MTTSLMCEIWWWPVGRLTVEESRQLHAASLLPGTCRLLVPELLTRDTWQVLFFFLQGTASLCHGHAQSPEILKDFQLLLYLWKKCGGASILAEAGRACQTREVLLGTWTTPPSSSVPQLLVLLFFSLKFLSPYPLPWTITHEREPWMLGTDLEPLISVCFERCVGETHIDTEKRVPVCFLVLHWNTRVRLALWGKQVSLADTEESRTGCWQVARF